MKRFKILFILTCFSFSMAWSQESKSQQAEYIPHNRTVEQVTENGRSIVRLSEGTGAGVDSVRRIHAVQYSFEPKFGFQQLRNTHKDKYESGINSPTVKATDWFHVKIEVKENRIKVFFNGGQVPCLEVTTLNQNSACKKIGFWVGNNSNGDFANLKISK
jgi:hypothetical protein